MRDGTAPASEVSWARPGGGHDRLIRTLAWALPSAVGVIAAFLVMAPLTMKRELGFTLQRGEIDRVPERLRAAQARYRGVDDEGRPFELTGASAVQSAAGQQLVTLSALTGRLATQGGEALVRAPDALFDPDQRRMLVTGPLSLEQGPDSRMTTSQVDLDLNAKTAASRAPVEGKVALGTFTADRMSVDLDERHLVLDGRARLHVKQGGLR